MAARYSGDPNSPRLGAHRHQSSPDLARHYKSSSPLPAVHLLPNSPPAEGKKHQAVQELPPSNTFTGNGGGNADTMSLGSDQCSDYSCQNAKYTKQHDMFCVSMHHSGDRVLVGNSSGSYMKGCLTLYIKNTDLNPDAITETQIISCFELTAVMPALTRQTSVSCLCSRDGPLSPVCARQTKLCLLPELVRRTSVSSLHSPDEPLSPVCVHKTEPLSPVYAREMDISLLSALARRTSVSCLRSPDEPLSPVCARQMNLCLLSALARTDLCLLSALTRLNLFLQCVLTRPNLCLQSVLTRPNHWLLSVLARQTSVSCLRSPDKPLSPVCTHETEPLSPVCAHETESLSPVCARETDFCLLSELVKQTSVSCLRSPDEPLSPV
ncbi:hypothetical protein P4O66_001837 [Electrophorus voltai]|uniref:Protocadherin domain-containing protein n=1 Tax=Electrophorus voltai TaxID=2609070 RepID=A0AAD8Z345_9TELE|nr:hypothetical protein P4O66_001837 [Electrophorus voltai]